MTTRPARAILGVVTVAYIIGAFVIGFWPTHVDAGIDRPLDGILAHLRRLGAPDWVDYTTVEFTANVLFFLPIGFLVCLLLRRRWWFVAIAVGVLGSATIELGQLLLRPERTASWGDIAANSLGTAIGVALVLIGRALGSRRRTDLPIAPAETGL